MYGSSLTSRCESISRVFHRTRSIRRAAMRIHAPSFVRSRFRFPLMHGRQVFPRPAVPGPFAATMVVMVVSIGLFDGRAPNATSNGRIKPEGRLRLDRLPARAPSVYFPCREVAAFLARQITRLTPSFAVLRA